ncbi:peptidylprolyl isomerase [Enhygromyxa salina]|nr:peptidylprolyl isomerase [Enhygromyxa salina]
MRRCPPHLTSRLVPSLVSCLISCLALACDVAAPGSFPPEDPELAANNEAAGDPHRGRFPLEQAVAGLPETGQLYATIVTDEGELRCTLLADVAPLAVANFVGLARGLRPFLDPQLGTWTTRPYYDGLTFHRAVERQFVQGGRLGEDKWIGFLLQDERSIGTAFDKPGVLALANQGAPNTSAGEFFVTTEVLRNLDGQYTIIGRCEPTFVARALAVRTHAGERPVIQTVQITRE